MFQLNMKSGKSLYEQVIDNIKELIMTDVLPENSKLPSVRDFSKELTVNPNTVQKAFRELEREGYVFTISGKGTFVNKKSEVKIDPKKIAQAKMDIISSFKELLYMGISLKEAEKIAYSAIGDFVQEINEEKSND